MQRKIPLRRESKSICCFRYESARHLRLRTSPVAIGLGFIWQLFASIHTSRTAVLNAAKDLRPSSTQEIGRGRPCIEILQSDFQPSHSLLQERGFVLRECSHSSFSSQTQASAHLGAANDIIAVSYGVIPFSAMAHFISGWETSCEAS